MKILHVTPYFPPDRIGGVGEVVSHIHNGLLERGHDSHVLVSGHRPTAEGAMSLASIPTLLGVKRRHHSGHIREYDIVHAHHGEAIAPLMLLKLAAPATKLVLTMHVSNREIGRAHRPATVGNVRLGGSKADWSQRWLKAPLKHAGDLAALRIADAVTFISQSTAVDFGLSPDEVNVIYNGLPDLPAPGEPRGTERTDLLYVGSAGSRKRTDLLPTILEEVRRSVPGARLRIVGFRLEAEPRLLAQFKEKNLESAVIAEGSVSSTRLPEYYSASKLLVVPSIYEGLPMVILEALKAGLPVVATSVSGSPEVIVDGLNGFLVRADDPHELANRIAKVLVDDDLRTTLAQNAVTSLSSAFSIDTQVDSYLQTYAAVLKGSSP